jgi:PadR family transcriptional regulator PadR
MPDELDVLQGTLDLLVLRALSTAPMHGYNILAWLKRATSGELHIEDAALYPALHRLEARGFIRSEWGVSENNRRAKYYELTAKGGRKLASETATWERYALLMARVLRSTEGGAS